MEKSVMNRYKNKNCKIKVMSSDEATLAQKPLYDGYAVGHGPHGDLKYNRKKEKEKLRRELDI